MRNKAVYIATSAMTVGVQESKTTPGTFDVALKSGGVAPGIDKAVPKEDGFLRAGWLGIAESPGDPQKEQGMNDALNQWGQQNGLGANELEMLFVNQTRFKSFYTGATNGKLWPLIHSMPERVSQRGSFNSHNEVNKAYTAKLLDKINQDIANPEKPEIQSYDDVVVWAHDYHVFSVPGMLKEAIAQQEGPDVPTGEINVSFFHHEPWPNIAPGKAPEGANDGKIYTGLKATEDAMFKEILTNLIEADTLGFHTQDDADNFVKTIENFGVITDAQELSELRDKTFANPIGIPKERLNQELHHGADHIYEGIPAQVGANESAFLTNLREATAKIPADHPDQRLLDAKQRISDPNVPPTLHDYQSVMEGKFFDPHKIHIGSVQRFDYTKGISEFLDAYKGFLQQKQEETGQNPGQKYQFNLVTGRGRSSPIPAYNEYQEEVVAKIEALNSEFPGAVHHYQNGINNAELPLFGAMNDIKLAASIKDGYILSVAEMINAREQVLERDDAEGLITNLPSGIIISNGAGIAEDLGGLERTSNLATLSIVEPTPPALEAALGAQVERIERMRELRRDHPEVIQNVQDLRNISSLITNADTEFGQTAFNMISASIKPTGLAALAAKPRINKSIQRAKRKKTREVEGKRAKAKMVGI
ncbi:trehalose-6-phosphate synthase [Ascidiimonas sp. W6]|uniref:trehalose-6-phosphate synthase n=1 Tax=Ascidiimonas meishanensis TaxID=3128903 RepID=UPI0030EBD5DF